MGPISLPRIVSGSPRRIRYYDRYRVRAHSGRVVHTGRKPLEGLPSTHLANSHSKSESRFR